MPVILHLSDPHLDGTPVRHDRFRRALASRDELPVVDAIVVSGDLTDDGTPEQYTEFAELLPTTVPTVLVPGNHDSREAMRAALSPGSQGPLDVVVDAPGLRIVGLDSLLEGETGGRLRPESLERAATAIASAQVPVVLTLHHPPVAVGHDFMDRHGLHDHAPLAELISAYPRVAAVLTGHVHTAFSAHYAGRPLFGAPGIASALRLGDRPESLTDDAAPPAVAVHVFDGDSHVRTIFHALRA